MRVHDSQVYRKMDVTRERISRVLELREIVLSVRTGFSLVNAAVVRHLCSATKRLYRTPCGRENPITKYLPLFCHN